MHKPIDNSFFTLNSIFRKEVRSTKKMPVGTKNHLTEKFMKKTIGYQYNYHVAEFKSKVS